MDTPSHTGLYKFARPLCASELVGLGTRLGMRQDIKSGADE